MSYAGSKWCLWASQSEARMWIDRAVDLDPRYAPRRRELTRACAAGRVPDPDIPFAEPGDGNTGIRI